MEDAESAIDQLGARIGVLDRKISSKADELSAGLRGLAGALIEKGVFRDMDEAVALSKAWTGEADAGHRQAQPENTEEGMG